MRAWLAAATVISQVIVGLRLQRVARVGTDFPISHLGVRRASRRESGQRERHRHQAQVDNQRQLRAVGERASSRCSPNAGVSVRRRLQSGGQLDGQDLNRSRPGRLAAQPNASSPASHSIDASGDGCDRLSTGRENHDDLTQSHQANDSIDGPSWHDNDRETVLGNSNRTIGAHRNLAQHRRVDESGIRQIQHHR
jgi:hypothetical protein